MSRLPKRTGTRPRRGQAAAAWPNLGMRRVDWVRVSIGPSGLSFKAVDVGHRLPCCRPISLRTSRVLRAAEVPLVVHTSQGH